MGHRFKNRSKIGTGNHVVQIVAYSPFQLSELTKFLIIILCLGDFKFHQLMNIVGVSGSVRKANYQFESVKIVIYIINKVI